MPDEGGGGPIDIAADWSGISVVVSESEAYSDVGQQVGTFSAYERYLKRCCDIVGSLVGLALLLPLIMLVALAIVCTDGLPIFFVQERIGRDLRPFRMLKFRTMRKDAEAMLRLWRESDHPLWQEYVTTNFKLSRDPRMLRIGDFLRKYSLDELPQIWNVLRGDMSLVGPRPLPGYQLQEMLGLESPGSRMRHSVRPGLTGLWQISGRSCTTFAQLMALDLSYVKAIRFVRDLAIIAKTPRRVVAGKDAF